MTLLAVCGAPGRLEVKRVPLSRAVVDDVATLFRAQAETLLGGVDEVEYVGNYKPDLDEILVIDNPPDAEQIAREAAGNHTALPVLDTVNFAAEAIRALALVDQGEHDAPRLLVQAFKRTQNLQRGFSLIQSADTFQKLTDAAFLLETKLAAVIESGRTYFKSDHVLRQFVQMRDAYREATNQEVESFAQHGHFIVPDVAAFVAVTNQVTRKLITEVRSSGVLEERSVEELSTSARQSGLDLPVRDGQIALPNDKQELKSILKFLVEDRYPGPITGHVYVSNSKRPA